MNITDNNNNEYEIKMDGKFRQFKGGGVRYTKTGKGRFDLLPSDVITHVIDHISEYTDFIRGIEPLERKEILREVCYKRAINGIDPSIVMLDIACIEYIDADMEVTRETVFIAFIKILRRLAVHFEKGADKYGENNWKKGIPTNSFHDSGLRHLAQYLSGETDEPHDISAIWNFCCLKHLIDQPLNSSE